MFELSRNCEMRFHFNIANKPVAAAWLWYWKLIGHTTDNLSVWYVNVRHTEDSISLFPDLRLEIIDFRFLNMADVISEISDNIA